MGCVSIYIYIQIYYMMFTSALCGPNGDSVGII